MKFLIMLGSISVLWAQDKDINLLAVGVIQFTTLRLKENIFFEIYWRQNQEKPNSKCLQMWRERG